LVFSNAAPHAVYNLGVILDNELNVKQHVNSVAKTCFCHLFSLRQVRCRA